MNQTSVNAKPDISQREGDVNLFQLLFRCKLIYTDKDKTNRKAAEAVDAASDVIHRARFYVNECGAKKPHLGY